MLQSIVTHYNARGSDEGIGPMQVIYELRSGHPAQKIFKFNVRRQEAWDMRVYAQAG